MKKGKFYSVGVGPGDPMLITYRAVDIINKSDVIVAPKSGSETNIALQIVKEYVQDKKIVECSMPMTKDKQKLDESHIEATLQIEAYLNEGLVVSFLTLGDPSIYSTAMYIHKRLTEKEYETFIIPGVPSFCAAAASLNISLCENKELLHIIPASYQDVENLHLLEGNKILMKAGKSIVDTKAKLINDDKNDVMMVECASMKNEKVYRTLQDSNESSSYFSIIVIKEKK